MQLAILFLGVLIFIFYQFNQPPLFFDPISQRYVMDQKADSKLLTYKTDFNSTQILVRRQLDNWLQARHGGDQAAANLALGAASLAQQKSNEIRIAANKQLSIIDPGLKANDADYVFITFILRELPHGVIGLLIAAFFAATLSSKAAELNALGTSTAIDIYRHIIHCNASDPKCLAATRWFTACWGLIAIAFALFAHLAENLIQAVNILGSIFYGAMLGLFLVAFFIRRVNGTAIFWAALAAQALVFFLYFTLTISYLWYPLIGCAACIVFSLILQAVKDNSVRTVKEYES